jgi:antitoxin component of RelBE/YafQ-DinJ toxin-antitoxin module
VTQYEASPPRSHGSDGSDDSDNDSAPAPGDESAARKERVLHARIPESLDDAIRAAASELGMSVSNLVRNVLANAVQVVEAAAMRVPARAPRAARPAAYAPAAAEATSAPEPAAPAAAPAESARVLGWQEATLNLNAVCDRCNAILARGTRGAISIPEPASAPRAIRCLPCLEELSRDPADVR